MLSGIWSDILLAYFFAIPTFLLHLQLEPYSNSTAENPPSTLPGPVICTHLFHSITHFVAVTAAAAPRMPASRRRSRPSRRQVKWFRVLSVGRYSLRLHT